MSPSSSNFPSPTPQDQGIATSGGFMGWVKDRSNWWLLLAALVVPFVGYRAVKKGFSPHPTFHCRPDEGDSDVNDGVHGLAVEAQIILSPNIAAGDYQVTTDEANLVRQIRRHNV
jgi:hypothetical protein